MLRSSGDPFLRTLRAEQSLSEKQSEEFGPRAPNTVFFLYQPEETVGIFRIPVELKNWQNRFLPPEKQGEDLTCNALVDSGAAELSLPAELIERLKLEPVGDVQVYTADGGQHTYRVFGIVDITVQGRSCQVRAIELPRGTDPLLGAVPLEEMDWHISPLEKRLLPNPKSPEKPLLPLC